MTIDLRLPRPVRLCLPISLPALLLLAGCGGGEPPRFELSGTVTYDGQPVPAGFIVFEPDAAAGNSGPGAQADIHDGKYRTLPGRGTIGGPHVVSVFGFDGIPYQPDEDVDGPAIPNPMGKPLFGTATIRVDLPKQTAVHDIVVPKQ